MDVYEYFLSGSRERFEMIRKEPLLTSFTIDFAQGKYGSLAEEIRRELKHVGEQYELKLIANGKKRGTIRDDLDDKLLLLFFQGVTEKFTMLAVEIAKGFKFEPTEEQLLEMKGLMESMVLLLKQGMGRD